MIATAQGRLREAQNRFRESADLRLASGDVDAHFFPLQHFLQIDIQLRGHPEVAIRSLDSTLVAHPLDSFPPYNRPYLVLAGLYAKAGNTDRAERLYHEWERVVSSTEQQAQDGAPGTRGLIALARGRYADAIAQFRASAARVACGPCYMYETGQAFEALHQPDSALAAYETMANTPSSFIPSRPVGLAPAYLRLGELYEAKGDTKKALEYYGKFVDIWKGADPELQPRVAEVRKRIAELSARER
jgi:tetratricopeptide (TPR) repeat protein